jgi:hypothetical protein
MRSRFDTCIARKQDGLQLLKQRFIDLATCTEHIRQLLKSAALA